MLRVVLRDENVRHTDVAATNVFDDTWVPIRESRADYQDESLNPAQLTPTAVHCDGPASQLAECQ